jgi:hypothetical protein
VMGDAEARKATMGALDRARGCLPCNCHGTPRRRPR